MQGFDEIRARLGYIKGTNTVTVGIALVDALEAATKHIIDAIERAQAPIPPAEAVVHPDPAPAPDVLTEWPETAPDGEWRWSTVVKNDGNRWMPIGRFNNKDDGVCFTIDAARWGNADHYDDDFAPGETFTRIK